VERVARIALVEDRLRASEAAAAQIARHVLQRAIVGGLEEARGSQAFGDVLWVHA
jgi:hypothetical protein